MNSPAEEGRRCWTLHYADNVQFHMDILPAIPDSEPFRQLLESRGYSTFNWADLAIAITDRTHPNYMRIHPDWPCSNPRGYAEWFRSRMKIQYDAIRKSLMERQVEEVPEYKIKTPLQRAVQILKRHRDIMFVQDPDNKPISIIITTLAGHAYKNESNTLDALQNLVKEMPNHIYKSNGVVWIPNPVNPLENFADKWQEHPQREQNFYKWLQQVQQDLDEMLDQRDIQSISESLKPRLGEQVVNKAIRDLSEGGNLYTPILAAGISRKPDCFDVPHRQAPKWQMILDGRVKITGTTSRKGFRTKQIESDSAPLPKYWSLRFEAQTNVLMPYEVHWQIVNTGEEAFKVEGLRGGFYKGNAGTDDHTRKERTQYRGKHWIECFIVKNGICRARSGEFVVNIE